MGLVAYDKCGQLVRLSNFSVKAWGKIKHNQMQIMGYVFAIKFHPSGDIRFIFCPHNQVWIIAKITFNIDGTYPGSKTGPLHGKGLLPDGM